MLWSLRPGQKCRSAETDRQKTESVTTTTPETRFTRSTADCTVFGVYTAWVVQHGEVVVLPYIENTSPVVVAARMLLPAPRSNALQNSADYYDTTKTTPPWLQLHFLLEARHCYTASDFVLRTSADATSCRGEGTAASRARVQQGPRATSTRPLQTSPRTSEKNADYPGIKRRFYDTKNIPV